MKKFIFGAVVALASTVAFAQYSPAPTTPTTPATPTTPTAPTATIDNGATWGGNVTVLSVEKGKRTEAQGSLAVGQHFDKTFLPNKCISDSDQVRLNGNQVLFAFTLPAETDVKISVVPKDMKAPINIYAYTLPNGRFDLPTKMSSLWTPTSSLSTGAGTSTSDMDCKTSFAGKTAIGKAVKGDDRVIRFDGKKIERNVVIGVSAPAGTTANDFILTVEGNKD